MSTHLLRRTVIAVAAAATLVASAGCLHAEKTHTLYVALDGTVTWSVMEREVRSGHNDPTDAAREEQDYITRARAGTHPVATAFYHLAAIDVTTQVIRDERPFTVVTTAQFPSLGVVGDRLIDALGVDGSSAVTTDGARSEWTLTIRSEPRDTDVDLTVLLDEPWHIVLIGGRFVGARNLLIGHDQLAILLQDCPEPEVGMPLVWSLMWSR